MKINSIKIRTWAMGLSLIAAATIVGCKSTTEPADSQYTDSQAAAEVTAAGIGDASGGSLATVDDAFTLGTGGTVQGTDALGKSTTQSRTETYDSTTHLHTLIFSRNPNWGGGFSYDGQWTYTYEFFDASGNPMKSYVKGTTDKLVISEKGGHIVYTPRVHVTDSSNGNWTLTGLTTTIPTLNGTYNQAGSDSIMVGINAGRAMTHTFQINHTNDQIYRDLLSKFVYLVGTGNSSFSATSIKGVNFTRTTQITFNSDGTATLAITRTSGNGTVDTFTIDVKQGWWLR
jgi:hypothetical protein